MKVENMTYNAKTAFTERREIIDKLNECINSINTYGPEKIADLESKNVQQDSDINNLYWALDRKTQNIETKNVQQDSDIANLNTKISNIETKNAQQDADIDNLKNADTNNVKINKINEYAVGLTGNQDISGFKTFRNNVIRKTDDPGGTKPEEYSSSIDYYIVGNDNKLIIGLGHEKSNTDDVTRLVFRIYANTDIETNIQPHVQIHYIYDETNKKLSLRPAHIDKNGNRTFGAEQVLMTW